MTSNMESSLSTAGSPPLLSPRSKELRSLLPSVNVTRLPASVSGLLSCVGHEITVIEDELNRCYDNEDEGTITGERMESLEDAIDDGFMCVDLRVIERKLEVWHRLFSPSSYSNNINAEDFSMENFDHTVTPFFAVKCNPDPVVAEWLARSSSHANLPLGFDCASIAELELAKKNVEKYALKNVTAPRGRKEDPNRRHSGNNSAVPTTRIVYANPQRAEADLVRALELFGTPITEPEATNGTSSSISDLWLTLDGVEEVYKIAIARKRFLEKHDPNRSHERTTLAMPRIKIILRIWVPDGHSQVPLGEKFGMQIDQIDTVVEACLEHGIDARDVIGISFHCGSGCESVETYQEALEMGKSALAAINNKLRELAPSETHRCWLLDVGGGFPGLDGLYGDDGRFSAGGDFAITSNAIEEKKEGDDATRVSMALSKKSTTVADIAVAVRPILQSFSARGSNGQDGAHGGEEQEEYSPLTLIAEPGRYFVEGAIALASRIYQKQIVQRGPLASTTLGESDADDTSDGIRVYRIPHGVQGVFKDILLCGESFVPQPLQMSSVGEKIQENNNGEEDEEESLSRNRLPRRLYLSRVLGPSGDDSEDVVCDSCWLPELGVGDWLVFDRMGAYTLSIASRAGRPVMRYVMGGGNDSEKD